MGAVINLLIENYRDEGKLLHVCKSSPYEKSSVPVQDWLGEHRYNCHEMLQNALLHTKTEINKFPPFITLSSQLRSKPVCTNKGI